jgi:hypothetical protein
MRSIKAEPEYIEIERLGPRATNGISILERAASVKNLGCELPQPIYERIPRIRIGGDAPILQFRVWIERTRIPASKAAGPTAGHAIHVVLTCKVSREMATE